MRRLSSLTRVPEELDGDADSPPLSSRDAPHVVVSHPGVSALPQPQLCDDVVHLRQESVSGAPQSRQQRCELSPGSHPLVPLSLREVGGEPQFGHEGQSLTDGEVRKKAVILADVRDALLHQLRRVGPPVNQNLPGRHFAAFVAARDDIEQRRFPTTWKTRFQV